MLQRHRLLALAALLLAGGCNSDRVTDPATSSPATGPALDRGHGEEPRDAGPGAVFTMTNGSAGNDILVFPRRADGSLGEPAAVPTGGVGTGTGLGNQGGLALSGNGRWLFAVNAGSNDVSAFRVGPHGLRLVARVPSGGTQPISLTLNRNVLYVLNAGGDGNIAGFWVGWRGLAPIPGSVQPLSGTGVGPAQIGFHPSGRLLVVTEKATNQLTVYRVDQRGRASAPTSYASNGMTPFGFAFDGRGTLVVSEAFGGATDASAVSSYRFRDNGAPAVRSGSVPDTESAACWIAITENGKFAYTTNAASGSISGYAITPDGRLELLDEDGVTGSTGPGSGPIDMTMSRNSRYLYSLNSGNGTISVFLIRAGGSLESLGTVNGLPATANGLAGL